MPRRKAAPSADAGQGKDNSAPAPGPVIIDPRGVYRPDWLQKALGLPRSTLRREIRQGRLAVSRRANRYFILGRQLLDWLDAGEVVRRRRDAAHDVPPAAGGNVGPAGEDNRP
jgi:hypothetical protein